MLNIPIYRARKQDSDEWVEGWYYRSVGGFDCMCYYDKDLEMDWEDKIDLSTLAIHFDKKDKNNKPIFFSFSKDWIGGSIVEYQGLKYVAVFDKKQERSKLIGLDSENILNTLSLETEVKVIEIHKG